MWLWLSIIVAAFSLLFGLLWYMCQLEVEYIVDPEDEFRTKKRIKITR